MLQYGIYDTRAINNEMLSCHKHIKENAKYMFAKLIIFEYILYHPINLLHINLMGIGSYGWTNQL